jgi:hypothetical protein
MVNRTKNQYRVLFSDGGVLMATVINGKLAGFTKGLYLDPMYSAWSSFARTTQERLFCGGAISGFVYQMDKGTSFDGGVISAFLVFNWNSIKTPRVKKRFHRASIELQSPAYAALQFGYNLNYGNVETHQPGVVSYDSGLSAIPLWDAFFWDAFFWDGNTLAPTNVRVSGSAQNIQYSISTGTNYIASFTINSIITHYSPRRGLR